MGLNFPHDLDAWRAWQQGRRPVRRLVGKLRPAQVSAEPQYLVGRRDARPARIVVAFESHSPSSLLSLGTPLAALTESPVALVIPTGFDRDRLAPDWSFEPWDGSLARLLPDGGVVLSGGHYLPLGATLHEQADAAGARFTTVQHGLMTPHAPPLAPDSHLLAWSQADADFWRSGRADVTTSVVGSQLLWKAALHPTPHVSRFAHPVFLGQLHGAELPRAGLARAASQFCLETGATYRPHPAEIDRLSRAQHRLWARRGIAIDDGRTPLAALDRPVVSAFSTGVLESAARGVPAWVFYPDAPAWLQEFWRRYGMSEWGGRPTPTPELPRQEPAAAVATWARENVR